EAIRQQISDQVWKDLQQQLDDLGQQTSDRLHAIAKKALPEGKDACADLQRWANHALPTFEVMQATVLAANKQADDLGRAAYARTAAQELSMGNLLLEMVLAEAQVEMLRWSGDAARQAFEKHVHYYYDLPMENAEERLRNPRTMGNFEIPDEQDLMQGVLLAGLLIPVGGALTPGYGETLDGCGAEPQGGEWKLQPGEPAFAVGIGIVQVEYKPNSDEVKLQVGQGLMAAGTWSPANGFGFQVGSGYNVKVGPGELSAAQWIKFGSDGSITQEIEGSASAGKGLDAGWQRSATREIRAATHEPIGALE
ncbi:MAG TPA: hypothetical protein VD902_06925, partial [Symbiobacteriaceae bacterium]|nr:hypothetical protein [Symbiobacteriaceae bacterium]